ncbi:MAG: transcriptional regulator [Actinobacteria bacterium]|nr:MAG: transcriptional regulator [Actinomycetota bacterium]
MNRKEHMAQTFSDIIGDIDPERRARIDSLKVAAHADSVVFSLAEIRKARKLTQVELGHLLNMAQPSISAMETSQDNLLSTVRAGIEAMGGRLELVAVFDDERIAIDTAPI